MPSNVITGTAMNVISDHAAPTSVPTIASPIEPPCWISAITVPTSAARAAQPAIAPSRSRATAKPSATVASRP